MCWRGFPEGLLREPAPKPLVFSSHTSIDTDTSPLCASNTNIADYCVVAASSLDINSAVDPVGSRPLVLVATNGPLRMGPNGRIIMTAPATATSGCNAARQLTYQAQGGAGGSFVGRGGRGAQSDTPGAPVNDISRLRFGCPGQNAFVSMIGYGQGGQGGGGVHFISSTEISIAGTVNVSGYGGSGGLSNASSRSNGGGGGGSGGMIGFDAPVISATGTLLASGGGGGGGAGIESWQNGFAGGVAHSTAPASGGYYTYGGRGGMGSFPFAGAAGSDGETGTGGGGGGGGGGSGIIKAPAHARLGFNVAPLPVQ